MPASKEVKIGSLTGKEWLIIAIIGGIAYVLLSGRVGPATNKANANSGTSVINASSSPMASIAGYGHNVMPNAPSAAELAAENGMGA